MDSWVEPPLKAPAPSFEDYGLERHSLFEQMAPLGSIPTDKLKLKLKFKSEVPRKPAVAKADGASATPELTPPLEQMATPKPVETSKPVTPARVDEKDKDYILNGSGAAGVAAPPKPAPKATTAAAAARNGTVSANHSPKKPVSGLMTVTDRGPPTTRNPELRKKYDVIVAAAVERSREQGQEILGQACRRIYEDSHYDQDIATLLDAVLNETASPQQRAAFAKTVKKAKKAIRAETGAKRAQSVGSNATSQRASSRTDKTTPAISNTTKATPPLPPPSPVGRISTPTTPATAFTIAVATAAPELRAARENPSASAHMNGEAPEPQLNTNGMGTRLRSRPSRSSAVSQLAEPISKQVSNNTTPVTNGRETRSGRRRASTSSLSSVDEEIVNEGPPPPSLGAGAKRTAADAGLSFEDEYNTARRRKLPADLDARRYDYERLSRTSDIRRSPPAPLLKSGITLNFTGGGRTTRSNLQRRARDGTDALESPMLSPNAQGLAPSGTHSRSGRSLGPPDRHVRKPRTGARTKIS
jgi:hypothetical protein